MKGRGRRDAEPSKGKMMETPNSEIVSTPRSARPFGKLRRIAKLAREMSGVALNTLAHHIDMGFTHYWGRTRRGGWAVKRKMAADRFGRALSRIAEWCRKHRHDKVKEQWRALCLKLKGHFGYYGITGNLKALDDFRYRVKRVWRKWLSRRSQMAFIAWDCFALLEQRYPLPPARLAHPLRVT